MFAPGAEQLAKEFHIANSTVASMTVSLYVLGFAIGPLILAPLSELYGRLVIYHGCNSIYFAFTLGCALSTNTAMFLVFRFLCGCAAAGPMSIGGGSIADIYPQEQRGKAMALFSMGPLLGPVSSLPSSIGISAYNPSCRFWDPLLAVLYPNILAGVGLLESS